MAESKLVRGQRIVPLKKKRKFNILVIDDEPIIRMLLESEIKALGDTPICFSDGEKAIEFLKKKDKDGIENHKKVALIICDLRMPKKSGYEVLDARNKIDVRIPFYLLSGNADPIDTAVMTKNKMTGYLQKPIFHLQLVEFFRKALFEHINLKKEPILFKIGGSADDYDKETKSKALKETLDFLVELQKKGTYQVILTVGGGKIGDLQKSHLKKYGSEREIAKKHPEMISQILELNAQNLSNLIGEQNSVVLKDFDTFDWNTNKIIIADSVPRHLTLNYPDIAERKSESYPNLSLKDSDAHLLLLAEVFGAQKIGLIKRTDQPYLFDPYKGFEKGKEAWKTEQKKNKGLKFASYKELLEGKTKDGQKVSRVGAHDGQDGHLIEDSALKLFAKSSIKEISVFHVDPLELFVDGTHVITGEPQKSKDSRKVRNKEILSLLTGRTKAGIIK